MVLTLGWIAAAIGCCISLPQLVRLMRTRSVAGLSVLAWQLSFGSNLSWTTYGVIQQLPNVWAPNTMLTVCTLLILGLLRQATGVSWVRLLLPGLALGIAFTTVNLTLGPIAFAAAAVLPSAFSQIAQLVAVVRSPVLDGISYGYLMVNVVNQTTWVVWALFAGQPGVVMAGCILGALMITNLSWALLRRYQVVPVLWALAA